jgi:hypothetical protein
LEKYCETYNCIYQSGTKNGKAFYRLKMNTNSILTMLGSPVKKTANRYSGKLSELHIKLSKYLIHRFYFPGNPAKDKVKVDI